MDNVNIIKEFYEKEKNHLTMSYDEFILLIENLYKTFENKNCNYTNNNTKSDNSNNIKMYDDLMTNCSKSTENNKSKHSFIEELMSGQDIINLSKTLNYLSEFTGGDLDSFTKNIEDSISKFSLEDLKTLEDTIKAFSNSQELKSNNEVNNDDNNEDNSFTKNSQNLENEIKTLSYPSDFTSDSSSDFLKNINSQNSFEELSVSSLDSNRFKKKIKKFNKNTKFSEPINSDTYTDIDSTTDTNIDNNTDTNTNIDSNSNMDKFSKPFKNKKISKNTRGKINIKVNPHINYDLNIDINDNICISIQ